jgi:hypothetical protein
MFCYGGTVCAEGCIRPFVLNIVMLSVIMLSVVAPTIPRGKVSKLVMERKQP